MRARSSSSTDLALIAVFAGLIAAFSLTPAIPVGALGVPITLQTLGVLCTGMVLGSLRGFLATSLYIIVGLAGLPVFAGGLGGLAIFVQPSIGYLLSFPVAAAVVGWLARRIVNRNGGRRWLWFTLAGVGVSLLIIHPAGIVGMSIVADIGLAKAFAVDLLFWPGDVIKSALAAGIAVAVHKAFPSLLGDAVTERTPKRVESVDLP